MNGQESCFNNDDKILGDFGVRTMHAKTVGYFIHKHVHNYNHLEEVISGSIELTLEENNFIQTQILNIGDMVLIPAKVFHTARSLKKNTVLRCIFHVKNAEGKNMVDLPETT